MVQEDGHFIFLFTTATFPSFYPLCLLDKLAGLYVSVILRVVNLKNLKCIIFLEITDHCTIQEEFDLSNCDVSPEKITSIWLRADKGRAGL